MAVGNVLYSRATTHGGTAALIGTRCYPLVLPQAPVYPALTYQVISRVQRDGEPVIEQVRVQMDCWALTYAGAQALMAQVRSAFDGWRQMDGGATQIAWMQQVNEQDLFESAPEAWRVSADFLAQVEE